MAISTSDVAASLVGVTISEFQTTAGFNPSTGLVRNEKQADGSYIVPSIDSLGSFGATNSITFEAVAGQPSVLSYMDAGQTDYVQVLGFDGTHVLLGGVTLSGQTVFGNHFVLSDGGVPPSTIFPLHVFPTGASYTNPNGTTIGSAPCFGRGTIIATLDGDVAVEDLREGDLVLTVSGEARPLVWTGSRSVSVARHPRPDTVRPVRIRRSAFSPNVPSRDLIVSPDHNIFVQGVLIPAKCLVNGRSVVNHDVETVDYHHIELAGHDVVYANGLEAETYLDTGNRTSFAGQGVTVAHPDFASAPDQNYFAWEANGYARLVLEGPEVERTRAILAARADAATRVTRVA